jgi:hypothetical protein
LAVVLLIGGSIAFTGCNKENDTNGRNGSNVTGTNEVLAGNFKIKLISSNVVNSDGNYEWVWEVNQIAIGGKGNPGLSHFDFYAQQCIEDDDIVEVCWSTTNSDWTCVDASYQVDNSQSCYTDKVLKIDYGKGAKNYYKVIVSKRFCVSPVGVLLKHGNSCTLGEVDGIGCGTCEIDPCDDETAWADGARYTNKGNWGTYTEYVEDATVTLYAGQTIDVGNVHFSAVDGDGNVTITINLASGWVFQNGDETVKIQNYTTAPSGNPSPGQFDHKCNSCTSIVVPANNYYGIHLDVQKSCDE